MDNSPEINPSFVVEFDNIYNSNPHIYKEYVCNIYFNTFLDIVKYMPLTLSNTSFVFIDLNDKTLKEGLNFMG